MKFFERAKLRFRAARYKKSSDRSEIAFLENTLKAGQCAFDIGAHRGAYLYFMRQQVTATGRVVAFEPQSSLQQHLEKVRSAFGWDNVVIEDYAMSDTQDGGTLYVPHHKKASTTTQLATISTDRSLKDFKPFATIRTDTIDAYCARMQVCPDFLKIDVEGNELRVLRGAEKTLREHDVALLVEIEARHAGADKMQETFDWMTFLGYDGYLLHDDGPIPLDGFDQLKHQDTGNMKAYFNNFIFLKKGRKN